MFDNLMIIETFQQTPLLWYFYITIIGLLVGSFLNVVIYRLPVMMQKDWQRDCKVILEIENEDNAATEETFNLLVPRSHCPSCKSPVKAWQNIPVISYLLLKGKCGSCQHPISIRYPLVELVTGLLSLAVAWKFGISWTCISALLLVWCLISLTMIDFDHQLLPDNITLPLVWLGLISNYFGLFCSFEEAFWGAIAGYMSLWSIYWLFKIMTGKEGMGYGDFKLFAAIGAFLGWKMLLPVILFASISGTMIGVLLLLKKQENQAFAFGPFLAIGGLLSLFLGHHLTQWLGL